MLRPSDSRTKSIARLVMRTQAVPIDASANGNTASTIAISAMPTHAPCGFFLMAESASITGFLLGAVADALAQQSRGPEDEHGDQHQECEHILVIAAEQRQVG